MAYTSASSAKRRFKYDVFLSFRGEDTRKNFVDNLYHALQQRGINTYKDDEEIKRGKRISDELITSIQDSKFHIIVFSKNYVSSSWCLDELVKIMECQKTNEHTVYPIFYDVEPTEIRHQSGIVGEAFLKHVNEEAAQRWRDALKEAAGLAGRELKNTFDGHEAKFIQKVVEEISLELRFITPNADENLVGMDARVRDVVSSLELDVDDVRLLGIKGMGGAGKTTLARAVFDQISFQFEGSSFVEDVREVSKSSLCGLKSLQKQVLSDVLNTQNITINGVYEGKNMMKQRMCGVRVLVVLDDVDHIHQLEALAAELNWFKSGSRVIITTREEQVLVAHRVPKKLILNVNMLSHEEAVCLFSRHAFGTQAPVQGYEELSKQVVRYAAGLPLTIRVLGSFLCGKDDLEWTDALERLKTIPLKETLEKLELSYDGLEEDYKEIFLDVACLLKGWKKEKAIRALESCGFHAISGLKVLELKSLISVSESGRLGMHDHIEEMGQNIVRRLHPNKPYKHSRLWVKEEIEDILDEDKGTKATRCIKVLKVDAISVMKGLRKMKELRFLDVTCENIFVFGFGYDDYSSDDYESDFSLYEDDTDPEHTDVGEDSLYLPNSLRYLRWDGYPFKCLPINFQADNLVGLEMYSAKINQVWEGKERKVLKKLRFIHLVNCYMLRSLDTGQIPNLERLSLVNCDQLEELHMPGETFKLRFIDLTHCKAFRSLDIGLIPNLERLSLVKCKNLEEFHIPANHFNLGYLNLYECGLRTLNLEQAQNLSTLIVEETICVTELHLPAESLNLKHLTLHCSMLNTLNITGYQNLETLYLDCNDLEELHFPVEKIKRLLLLRSNMKTLNLMQARNLEALGLLSCEDLLEVQMPIESPQLEIINIRCSKLRALNLTGTRNLEKLDLEQCENLVELHMPIESPKLKNIHIHCSKLKTFQLGVSPAIERLNLHDCFSLVEIHAPVGCLSGSVTFKPFLVNQGFPMLGSVAEFHLTARSLDMCPLHTDNNLPKFHFKCIYQDFLPSSSSNLKKLITSSVCACTNLASLSGSICSLQLLKKLTLEGCIPYVPKEIERLECLEELTLLSTNIEHLPNSICKLTHLKVLLLKSCWFLKQLPEDLGRLECIEDLRIIDFTSLRDIPNSICEMKHLKCFHLINCILVERLPKEMGGLKCLKELNIQGTGIKDIPESIFQLEDLVLLI